MANHQILSKFALRFYPKQPYFYCILTRSFPLSYNDSVENIYRREWQGIIRISRARLFLPVKITGLVKITSKSAGSSTYVLKETKSRRQQRDFLIFLNNSLCNKICC